MEVNVVNEPTAAMVNFELFTGQNPLGCRSMKRTVPCPGWVELSDEERENLSSEQKYCNRPKIKNRNGASEKLLLLHIYSESIPEQVS
ncbi:unnamed protein product, partial [Nesidiocoris tenuis]